MTFDLYCFLSVYSHTRAWSSPDAKTRSRNFPLLFFLPSTYNIRDRLLYGTFSMVCLLISLILPIPKIKN